MPWGDNPTYKQIRCRFCGIETVDDGEAFSSHELACPDRWKGARWIILYLLIMIVLFAAAIVTSQTLWIPHV